MMERAHLQGSTSNRANSKKRNANKTEGFLGDALKQRLDSSIDGIETQIEKLDKTTYRFTERDKRIYARIVDAHIKKDFPRARVFAHELAKIRKMEKMIMHARLSLEQIVLRLKTVSELGDVITTLAPAIGVLRSVRNGMSTIFPEAERELSSIGDLLSGVIMDAGQTTGLSINFETASEDAEKILNKTSKAAERKMKEELSKNEGTRKRARKKEQVQALDAEDMEQQS